MPRFVVLRHETSPGTHFDFMVETGAVLKTWALAEPPRPGVEIEATPLADHRPAYLDYEGPISGDRGSVTRWDSGQYTVERQTATQWTLRLAGEKLHGTLTLHCMDQDPHKWFFRFVEQADPKDSRNSDFGEH
jgi:hypothetical protein